MKVSKRMKSEMVYSVKTFRPQTSGKTPAFFGDFRGYKNLKGLFCALKP